MVIVSVIIPVYNAGALISRCLDSVFSQSGVNDFEVIVIDDGSTDNSIEIIKSHPEASKIKIINQKNAGPSRARNRGVEVATGKYLAFLDADDYWLPGFIQTTVSFLENHTECIAVSVAQRHLTTSGVHEAPTDWDSFLPSSGIVLDDFYAFWADKNHICSGSILIRTDIAKQTKGMRESLRICEDLEYWAYLALFGNIGFIPNILFVSDGTKVTENIGWVKKHLPRWNAATPADDWQKRILEKCPELIRNNGFLKARGRIARNLAYSILLSKRYDLAKNQIKKYRKDFPKDNMSRLLCLACKNPINWYIISRILVFREYHRR